MSKQLFPEWMLNVGTALFIAVILIIAAMFFKDVLTAIFSRQISTAATLISKTAQPYVTKLAYMQQRGSVGSGIAEKGTDYFFYFLLDNGKYITLPVTRDNYDTALENSHGTLTFKGKRFISFTGETDGTRRCSDDNANNFVSLKDSF